MGKKLTVSCEREIFRNNKKRIMTHVASGIHLNTSTKIGTRCVAQDRSSNLLEPQHLPNSEGYRKESQVV